MDGCRLVDFLPAINATGAQDMAILESWMRHFRTLGVPFVVRLDEHRPGYLKLWKEQRVGYYG